MIYKRNKTLLQKKKKEKNQERREEGSWAVENIEVLDISLWYILRPKLNSNILHWNQSMVDACPLLDISMNCIIFFLGIYVVLMSLVKISLCLSLHV